MAKLVTNDRVALAVPCQRSDDMELSAEVAREMLEEVEKREGIGLSSNQIGRTDVAVSVVNVKEQIVLINPQIIEVRTSDGINTADPEALPNTTFLSPDSFRTVFFENCLSFPSAPATMTDRFVSVIVKADNHDELLTFGPDNPRIDLFGEQDLGLLECIAVQHEIDHLNGITIFDRKYRQTPTVTKRVPGRNQMVTVEKDNETKTLKYKHAQALVKNEGWALLEEVCV